MPAYDAILLVSFGGPEGRNEVIPFLENVLRGKNVPRDRLQQVAEHYYHFDGVSPINEQNRRLIRALETELETHGPRLPVYWGNRNWHPLLPDTLRKMSANGVRRALAFVTSAFGSYSGCRQYAEDIARAQAEVGGAAPQIDKLPPFSERAGFRDAMADRVHAALTQIPPERRAAACLLFTAHSVPMAMAETSPYVRQLHEACTAVAERAGHHAWRLVCQSRSGPPAQRWLEPDVSAALRQLPAGSDVVVAPIGFLSDHMEVLYDLDIEARQLAGALGLNLVRAGTVGDHPVFVRTVRDMIAQCVESGAPPVCATECCA